MRPTERLLPAHAEENCRVDQTDLIVMGKHGQIEIEELLFGRMQATNAEIGSPSPPPSTHKILTNGRIQAREFDFL